MQRRARRHVLIRNLQGLADASTDATDGGSIFDDALGAVADAQPGTLSPDDYASVGTAAGNAASDAMWSINDSIENWLKGLYQGFTVPWWVWAGGAFALYLAWHHEFEEGKGAFG